ncbi:hypothetical protein [Actinomadura rugatobispora]|uniref:Uncharacterized protein n=1 Tax=Actinomadura rugatobispora TaxID=1994 RepID=A0ABW1ABY1_9ACTN
MQLGQPDGPVADRVQRPFDLRQDLGCPLGVRLEPRRRDPLVAQRITREGLMKETPPGDVLLDQVVVLPDDAVADQLGNAVQPGEPLQRSAVATEPLDRVATALVEPAVRPGLPQHQLTGPVRAAAVGDVEDLVDPVREPALGLRQMRPHRIGHPHPVRHREHRAPGRGLQVPSRMTERPHRFSIGVRAGQIGVIANVERTRADPPGAQRGRAPDAREPLGKLPESRAESVFTHRVEPCQHTTVQTVGGVGVLRPDGRPAAQEPERDPRADTVGPDPFDGFGGGGQRAGNVDPPPLLAVRAGREHDPPADLAPAPALRGGLVGLGEAAGRVGHPLRRVEEVRIGQAERLVALQCGRRSHERQLALSPNPGRTSFRSADHCGAPPTRAGSPGSGAPRISAGHNRPKPLQPHRLREQIAEVSARVNELLGKAVAVVRERFHGKVTYAAIPIDRVDWAPFDIVSVDLYRSAEIAGRFAEGVRTLVAQGKPVAITEFWWDCLAAVRNGQAAGVLPGRGFMSDPCHRG